MKRYTESNGRKITYYSTIVGNGTTILGIQLIEGTSKKNNRYLTINLSRYNRKIKQVFKKESFVIVLKNKRLILLHNMNTPKDNEIKFIKFRLLLNRLLSFNRNSSKKRILLYSLFLIRKFIETNTDILKIIKKMKVNFSDNKLDKRIVKQCKIIIFYNDLLNNNILRHERFNKFHLLDNIYGGWGVSGYSIPKEIKDYDLNNLENKLFKSKDVYKNKWKDQIIKLSEQINYTEPTADTNYKILFLSIFISKIIGKKLGAHNTTRIISKLFNARNSHTDQIIYNLLMVFKIDNILSTIKYLDRKMLLKLTNRNVAIRILFSINKAQGHFLVNNDTIMLIQSINQYKKKYSLSEIKNDWLEFNKRNINYNFDVIARSFMDNFFYIRSKRKHGYMDIIDVSSSTNEVHNKTIIETRLLYTSIYLLGDTKLPLSNYYLFKDKNDVNYIIINRDTIEHNNTIYLSFFVVADIRVRPITDFNEIEYVIDKILQIENYDKNITINI
ncbi:MAG: hypothetical protein OEV44_14280 [Spirochaetota bacterium]|nr:hypothetical protein [Spirochaetota bacterium]